MTNRYVLLTRLPLFEGISSTDLLNWEDILKLDIDAFPASDMPLIRQGDNCTQLHWLVEGELEKTFRPEDGHFATRSYLRAPAIIEVDRLFGLLPKFQHTYLPHTDIKMLSIRKSLATKHLMKNEVFRLNLLNLLSAGSQKRQAALLPQQLGSAEERLCHFLRTILPDTKGEAEVFIQMTELARYIGETRLTVSRILNRWDKAGVIRLGREHFVIHNIQTLPGF